MTDPMIETRPMPAPARALFVLTILTGSFLLFLVQPMIARIALPRLGGAPAVWNSAMLVYQALLLGGYAYAHALGRVPLRAQAMIHIGLLLVAALWLPIGLLAWRLPADADPVVWVPWLLGLSIGPLFLAVSAQAPLLQRWFAAASGGEDPYRLYAASNLGSFAGLIAYPLLVEPGLAIRGQSLLWSAGYILLIALVLLCAWRLPRSIAAEAAAEPSEAPTAARILYWIALAFVPSGLMLATSTYITTDIVAMPLLWVIPLGLYLLSFSVAFAGNQALADILTRIAPITILLFGAIMIGGFSEKPFLNAGVGLVLLFMASVALHTALFRARPAADRLTGFYLAMSFGGALGGVFAALIAPVVFDWSWEYPLLILAAGALVPQVYLSVTMRRLWWRPRGYAIPASIVLGAVLAIVILLRLYGPAPQFGQDRPGILFIALAATGLLTIGARLPYITVLALGLALFGGYRSLLLSIEGGVRTRSYFGVYTITDEPHRRSLAHGTTVHGLQLRGTPERERTPTTYYAPASGVGQAMQAAPALYGPAARIGVVGLGTGTLACYAQPGQDWRYYEIDPAVVKIARDPARFTFLSRCAPGARVVLGDARLSLAAQTPRSLDLLALDAFSSDAVPMHLITREAFAAYARALSPRGLLLVHISNRFLDLEPVVATAAKEGGWHSLRLRHRPSILEEAASASDWVALSRDPAVLRTLAARGGAWKPVPRYPGFTPWTDDYASILPVLKFE